jgi:hypothetical protein
MVKCSALQKDVAALTSDRTNLDGTRVSIYS